MKKILLIIFLHLFFLSGYGQSHASFAFTLFDNCDCPDRILSTDSVYSFLRASPLKELLENKRLFRVANKPLDQKKLINYLETHNILKRVIDYRFEEVEKEHGLSNVQVTDSLISTMGYYNARLIPPKPLAELFVAALDTTIRYTQPVEEWDVSRLGREWILLDTWIYLNRLIDKKIFEYLTEMNSSREDPVYAKGLSLADDKLYERTSYISMSMPVFDKEYNYALMLVNSDGIGFFKRTDKGWILLFILNNTWMVETSIFKFNR